jgi:hypothetical protein
MRLAYRQFHDQSAVAAVTTVILAEFGLLEFDPAKRGQELVTHGLIQQGVYRGERGEMLNRAALHMVRLGLAVARRHNAKRTPAILERIRIFQPEGEYHLARDLGAEASPPLNLQTDLAGEARLILIQAQMWNARLALHPLLLRAHEGRLFLMNPLTGRDEEIAHEDLSMHAASPVQAGPRQFAGGIYLDTGLALRVHQ